MNVSKGESSPQLPSPTYIDVLGNYVSCASRPIGTTTPGGGATGRSATRGERSPAPLDCIPSSPLSPGAGCSITCEQDGDVTTTCLAGELRCPSAGPPCRVINTVECPRPTPDDVNLTTALVTQALIQASQYRRDRYCQQQQRLHQQHRQQLPSTQHTTPWRQTELLFCSPHAYVGSHHSQPSTSASKPTADYRHLLFNSPLDYAAAAKSFLPPPPSLGGTASGSGTAPSPAGKKSAVGVKRKLGSVETEERTTDSGESQSRGYSPPDSSSDTLLITTVNQRHLAVPLKKRYTSFPYYSEPVPSPRVTTTTDGATDTSCTGDTSTETNSGTHHRNPNCRHGHHNHHNNNHNNKNNDCRKQAQRQSVVVGKSPRVLLEYKPSSLITTAPVPDIDPVTPPLPLPPSAAGADSKRRRQPTSAGVLQLPAPDYLAMIKPEDAILSAEQYRKYEAYIRESLWLKEEMLLPRDPRLWTREHVTTWVKLMSSRHSLDNIQVERFAMNGKALCLMTMAMFVSRVPLGGKLLYKDFHLRLSKALHGIL